MKQEDDDKQFIKNNNKKEDVDIKNSTAAGKNPAEYSKMELRRSPCKRSEDVKRWKMGMIR